MGEHVLWPVGPYALAASVARAPAVSRRRSGAIVELVFRTDGVPAFARLWQRDDGAVVAQVESHDDAAAIDELRFVLALDDDHTPFLDLAATDELLRVCSIPGRGIRPVRTSVAQALLHGFAGQLITGREAWLIERRVSEHLGEPHHGLRLPLSAAELRAATPADFTRMRLAPKRATALAMAARKLDLDGLRAMDTTEAVARLRREPMIGPWTAALVALNGLGSYAHGIAGDLGLMRLCTNLLGRRATVADTQALLARYGEWQGLASLHLVRHPLAHRRTAA